jgi:NADH-quinone oxidoreductase subunit H
MIYGLLQLGSYVKTYALAALFVILFLGGWAGPAIFPVELIPGYTGVQIYNHTTMDAIFWFTLKVFGVIMLMLLPRGISPRIRIDILLHTGWYKLIVLAFINIFVALALIYGGVLGPGGLLVR